MQAMNTTRILPDFITEFQFLRLHLTKDDVELVQVRGHGSTLLHLKLKQPLHQVHFVRGSLLLISDVVSLTTVKYTDSARCNLIVDFANASNSTQSSSDMSAGLTVGPEIGFSCFF